MKFSKSFNISIVCVCGAKLDGYLSDEGEIDFIVVVDNTHICPAAQHVNAADVARRCPACNSLLEETSVYCDNCGTDTPRR